MGKKELKKKLDLAKKYGLTKTKLLKMLRNVYLSRQIDDTEIKMKKQSKAYFQISGAGHEGVLTALSMILRPSYDYFIPYYRDRALCLGLGVTPYEMLCQANGNVGDTASYGRQMPAHFGNKKLNIISKSSCVGTQFLQACGLADTGKYLENLKLKEGPTFKKDEIIYVSTGDGTTSQGEFWEALTTAAVKKLPILFLVEDNGYAISTTTDLQTPKGSISKTLEKFPDLKVFECDGNCPIESFATGTEVFNYLQKGKGPALMHAHVMRPYSHSLSDDHSFYRSDVELKDEREKDVVYSFPRFLQEAGVFSAKKCQSVWEEIHQELQGTLEKVLETKWPEPDTYADHLYSPDVDPTSSGFQTKAEFSGKDDVPMAMSINRTLMNETLNNPLIRIFGQDVADFSDTKKLKDPTLKGKGGVFKVTSGIQKVGKENQVFNSPLAEANIIGTAIGMAMRGLKPVVEIQFFDYIWTAFMQLKNELATTRYRSGGDFSCPMVVRVPIGGYLKGGAIYHSQCGESIFTHIPGLRVIFPSNALDAAGLLRTAIRCDDPVLFLEHKHLYYQGYNRTSYPGDNYMIPFGKAHVVQEGTDATIVCWGALVQKSLEAAKAFSQEGYSIEVIDARTLAPFDLETVITSLKKTNRLLVAHEEVKTSGFAGEIMALINENAFHHLDAPIMRVAAKDTHVAYCPGLEEVILPQVSDVKSKLAELLNY